jgi:hypothetical protein
MSPRAAWRLEQLGFGRSIDYVGGKMDWLDFDLPWEGSAHLVGAELDRDVPTCTVGEKASEVRERLSSPRFCVVVFDGGVVAGSLDEEALRGNGDEFVERRMREGPGTVRASEEPAPLAERMRRKNLEDVIVTRPDGRLVGVYRPGP